MLVAADCQCNRLTHQRIVERLRSHIEVDPHGFRDAEDIGGQVSLGIDTIDPLRLIDSRGDI